MTTKELRTTTQNMTELISLIQQYPKAARRILAAVEDGLTLGAAQIMPSEMEYQQEGIRGYDA
jgi:hypothetical protein